MSFAKAKLQRFNEIQDCSPSPAKYNVASTTNKFIRCGLFTKSGRFIRKGSPTTSEASSTKTSPTFQTPTALPKKKKILSMSLTKSKSNDIEKLREKIVECTNKDGYIQDVVKEVNHLKNEISNLKTSKTTLESENEELRRIIEEFRTNEEKHLDELASKRDIITEMEEDLERLHHEYKILTEQFNENNNNIFEEQNKQFAEMIDNLKHEILKLEENNRNHQEENVELKGLIEQIKEESSRKITELHGELEKSNQIIKEKIEEIQKIKDEGIRDVAALREQHQKEYDILFNEIEKNKNDIIEQLREQLNEKDARILLLEENLEEIKLLSEMQTKEKCDEIENIWKMKLEEQKKESDAILKECQEISEYNIIETEIEKNKLKTELAELQLELQNSQGNGRVAELLEEVENLKTQQRAYEITINTNLETIEVLKKRLINSDRDVEQFKEELKICEEKMVSYENKQSELLKQLQECQLEKEELEMQFESTMKITEAEVSNTMKNLINKVDKYDGIVRDQLIKNEKDQKLFNDVYMQLKQQQELNNKAQQVIDQSKYMLENLEEDFNNLQITNQHLAEELEIYKNQVALYNNEVEEAAEIRKKYIETSGKYDEILQNHEQILSELENIKNDKSKLESRNSEMQRKIEELHGKIQKFDIELEALELKKSALEHENKELEEKYVALLGHQNKSQRIKHINDFKKDYGELFTHNIDLQSENKKLSKLIEQLNNELADMKKVKKIKRVDDKENIASPTRPLNRLDSPGPLRNKN